MTDSGTHPRQGVLLEDEALRDGLQFENAVIPLEQKLLIFEGLRAAGVRRIQVGSFVNPKIVPQMADTDEFVSLVNGLPEVTVTALVLNERGLERALACGLAHISLSVSASNAHSLKNTRKNRRESLQRAIPLIEAASSRGVSVRAGVQCSFGCVYEGAIDHETVLTTLEQLAAAGAAECNLADTAGMANPGAVRELVGKVRQRLPGLDISLHLHDTRGLALANMYAGYEAAVRRFDTSVGGIGGCPFVEGAAGNIATEDAVHLFAALGAHTGIDLQRLCTVAFELETLLGRRLPGRMGRVLQSLARTRSRVSDDPVSQEKK